MTVQAYGWAMQQRMPATPKLMLLSLADGVRVADEQELAEITQEPVEVVRAWIDWLGKGGYLDTLREIDGQVREV